MVMGLFWTFGSALEHRTGAGAGRSPESSVVGMACRLPSQPISDRIRWPSEMAVAEFGEKLRTITNWLRKQRQWSFGLWLGRATRTHEAYIDTPNGVAWRLHDAKERKSRSGTPQAMKRQQCRHCHLMPHRS